MRSYTIRNKRSQSSHGFSDAHPVLMTQPTSSEGLNQPKLLKGLEEKRIALLRDNAKFLKRKLQPLNENNSQLRHHVLALTYYIEQRRVDFAELLKSEDKHGNPRDLDKQLGDLIDIHAALREDLELEQQKKQQYIEESQGLKELLDQESKRFDARQDEHDAIITQLRMDHITQLDDKDAIIQKQKGEVEKHLRTINDLKHRMVNFEEIHKTELLKKQRDIDQHIQQAVYIENQHHQEIKELLKIHQQEMTKQADAHKKQLADQKSECDDLITKNELKYKKIMADYTSLKSDQTSVQSTKAQLQSQCERLANKLEFQLQENKKIRGDLSTAKEHVELANQQIQEAMNKVSKLNKERDDWQKRIQQSNEIVDKHEAEIRRMEGEYASLRQRLLDERVQHEQEVADMARQLEEKDLYWRKKYTNQKQKYESLLKAPHQENTEQTDVLQPEYIYQTIDFECQKEDEQTTLRLSQLEAANLELDKQLQQKALFEKTLQAKVKQEIDDRRRQLQKDHAVQLKKLQDQMQKEFDDRIESIEYKAKQDIEYHNMLISKEKEDKNQLQRSLQANIALLEEDLEYTRQQLSEESERYLQLKHHMYKNEQLIESSRQTTAKKHEQDLLDVEEKLAAAKQEHARIQEDLQKQLTNQKEDFKNIQRKMDEQSKSMQTIEQQKHDLLIQIKAQSQHLLQFQRHMEDREKLIQQQNDAIRYLQLEIENSKQVYNIFRGGAIPEKPKPVKIVEVEHEQMGYTKAIILNPNSRQQQSRPIRDDNNEKDQYNLNFNVNKREKMPVGKIRKGGPNQSQPLINKPLDQ